MPVQYLFIYKFHFVYLKLFFFFFFFFFFWGGGGGGGVLCGHSD